MTNFDNMDKVIIEIKKILNKNDGFRKLLKHNTPDALSLAAPTKADVSDLIKTTPAIYMNEDPDSITTTTFAVVYVPVVTFESGINDVTFMVDIFTKKEILQLNDDKLRLHQMLALAYKSLDNQRVSMAGRIKIKSASYVVIGTAYVGYQIELSIIDEAVENDF